MAKKLPKRGGVPRTPAKKRLRYAVRVRKNPEGIIVAQDLGPTGEGYVSAKPARRIAQAAADAGVGPHNQVYLERVRISRAAQRRARDTLESGLFQPVGTGPKRGAVVNPTGTVQSIGFAKAIFTWNQARIWARGHGYRWADPAIEETEHFYWSRQADPGQFAEFRTQHLARGVQARVGFGKPKKKQNPSATQHRASAAKMAQQVSAAPDEATRRYFEGALAAHADPWKK